MSCWNTYMTCHCLPHCHSQGQIHTQSGEGCERATRCMFMALGSPRRACALRSLNMETSSTSPWTTHASMEPLNNSVHNGHVYWLFCHLLLLLYSLFMSWYVPPVPISSCAFITFEKMESADQAVAEVGIIPYKRKLKNKHMIFCRR